MTEYRLVAEPRADLDVAAAYQWYENERRGLGPEFLDELGAAYDRIADDPLKYFVAHTEREDRLRIISARRVTPGARKDEEGIDEATTALE